MSSQNLSQDKNLEPKVHSFIDPEMEIPIEVKPVKDNIYYSANAVNSAISNEQSNYNNDISNQNLNTSQSNSYENPSRASGSSESSVFNFNQKDYLSQPNQPVKSYTKDPDSTPPTRSQTSKTKPNKFHFNFDIKKALIYGGLSLASAVALFINHPLGLLAFWLLSIITVKVKPNLAWIIVLLVMLYLRIVFPVANYLVVAGLAVTLLSAIFLGAKPSFSKFNKYITGILALILGLWIAVPMSQVGSLKYLQTEYNQNNVFQTVVNSLYIGAGSPKLSAAEIEKNFKAQISTEIATNIKDKTKLLPNDTAKIAQLCTKLGAEQNQSQACQNLDRSNLDKTIDSTVSAQVDQQTKDLKDQFYQYPQVQMIQNLLNGLVKSDNSILSSIYFIPGIVLFLIYAFVSGLLQLLSWPIMILLKRISLS